MISAMTALEIVNAALLLSPDVGVVEVTAALLAPTAEGALLVLCLVIEFVLEEVEEEDLVEVLDDDVVEEVLLVFVSGIELLLIFVFPLTH